MTCRINRASTEQGQILYVSGRLAAGRSGGRSLGSRGRRVVAIELAEVELVSRDAVKLLLQAEAEGIELRACPAYIREWITNEREIS